MKFWDMPYSRPDLEAAKETIKELTDKLANASTFEEAKEVFIQYEELNKHYQTMGTLAHIRHTIDTRDEFYAEEQKFYNNAGPVLQEYSLAFTITLLKSPFLDEFKKEFAEVYFTNAEMELKTFSPEIIPDMQEEALLVQKYEALLASASIPFNGETYTISQIAPYKQDPDDDVRLAAWKAEGQWYKDNQAELDDIYDKLVHLRDKMGRKLGYDGYTQLGYYRMTRNCYTKEDVAKFREAVVKYVVPVVNETYKVQAERLGKEYPMSFADNALAFRSGNAKPCTDAEGILAHGKVFYDALSPETSKFFNTMLDGDLLDVLSKEGKRVGGYCTSIPDYEVPFIFANFNGTSGDVETVTHEAGHAFAGWLNRKRIPFDTCWPSLEACEVHSMSMEFFAWPWAEGFFGDDTRKFRYFHLAESFRFIPYGTMVDHFQHIVYEKPDMTPKQRHETWKELLGIYMPWMKLDGDIPFYSEGEGWQRQHHIYSSPFYYIDYCLAQTVALEFWAMIQEDFDNAWKHYMAYTEQGGSEVFTKLLENAGMESPFEEETIKGVCKKADEWLKAYDLTGIN